MKLLLSLTLIWALSSTTAALVCQTCTDDSCTSTTPRTCSTETMCITAAIEAVSSGTPGQQIFKACASSSLCPATGSQIFSVNLGVSSALASATCCNTDNCNSATLSFPTTPPVNSLQCNSCNPATSQCTTSVQCTGTQDRCIQASCDGPTCCDTNLCNTVTTTAAPTTTAAATTTAAPTTTAAATTTAATAAPTTTAAPTAAATTGSNYNCCSNKLLQLYNCCCPNYNCCSNYNCCPNYSCCSNYNCCSSNRNCFPNFSCYPNCNRCTTYSNPCPNSPLNYSNLCSTNSNIQLSDTKQPNYNYLQFCLLYQTGWWLCEVEVTFSQKSKESG
uniref:keratin-associated protein 4-12-like n=1 Tax=Solea senegalensis TaxID=28829 RepID=UPI001CD907F2|nr:keratin-associated protein 4-12-like [Solea senegalensis]